MLFQYRDFARTKLSPKSWRVCLRQNKQKDRIDFQINIKFKNQ